MFNNEDLNQVTWEQRVMEGDPQIRGLPGNPQRALSQFGELIGLKGIYVDDPEQVGAAWDEALAAQVPVVLEVKTDPEVPPLPAHLTFDQVRNFMTMLTKGDQREGNILRETARQALSAVLPGDK